MKYLYHLTSQENAEKILRQGLIPQIGSQSQLCGETKEKIYLTQRKYIPYWGVLLGKNVVLKVDKSYVEECGCDTYTYSLYEEVSYSKAIPPEAISTANIKIRLSEEQNLNFCLSLVDSISAICVSFAKYISYKDDKNMEWCIEDIADCITILKNTTQRVDFSAITKSVIRNHLKLCGNDGEYTLCDEYCYPAWGACDALRLWELLGTNENSTEDTRWLYEWLKKNLSGCLFVRTGGWTG